MKTILSTFTFLLLTFNLLSAQTDTIKVKKEYQTSFEKPIFAGQGSIAFFYTDTAYIINSGRLKFYENLRTLLNKDLSCKELISAYENSLNENTKIINNLIKLSDKEKKLHSEAINGLTGRLNFLQNTLNENNVLLNNADNQIKELKKQLKQKNRKTYLNYGIIAVSGVLTGILITKIK